jgi:phage terminase small subunit
MQGKRKQVPPLGFAPGEAPAPSWRKAKEGRLMVSVPAAPSPVEPEATRLTSPPPHLEAPEALLFRQLVREFRIDDGGSVSLLTVAMEAHQRARRARERIDREGEVINDRFGCLKAHPCIAIERDARDAYMRALRLLNLQPGAAAGNSKW